MNMRGVNPEVLAREHGTTHKLSGLSILDALAGKLSFVMYLELKGKRPKKTIVWTNYRESENR